MFCTKTSRYRFWGVNLKVMKTPEDLKSVSHEFSTWSPWLTVILTPLFLVLLAKLRRVTFVWSKLSIGTSCMRISLFILTIPYGLFRSWLVVLVVLQKEATLSSPLGPSPFGHPKPSKFRHASQPWMSSSCSSCANFRPNCASDFWSSSRQLWIIPTVGGWQASLNQKTQASLFGCLARTLRIDGFWAKKMCGCETRNTMGTFYM